jgi:hypothetical protein
LHFAKSIRFDIKFSMKAEAHGIKLCDIIRCKRQGLAVFTRENLGFVQRIILNKIILCWPRNIRMFIET